MSARLVGLAPSATLVPPGGLERTAIARVPHVVVTEPAPITVVRATLTQLRDTGMAQIRATFARPAILAPDACVQAPIATATAYVLHRAVCVTTQMTLATGSQRLTARCVPRAKQGGLAALAYALPPEELRAVATGSVATKAAFATEI